jgi:hypothetical protein
MSRIENGALYENSVVLAITVILEECARGTIGRSIYFDLSIGRVRPIFYTSTESLISNTAYPKTANTTIAMTSTELHNPGYMLGYLCSWTPSTGSGQAGQWKCGCRDSACTQSYWQIQKFQR